MGLIQNIVNLKQAFLFSIRMYVKRSSVAQTSHLDLRNIIVGVLFKGNIYQLNTVVWTNGCISCRCVFVVVRVPLIWGDKQGSRRREDYSYSIKKKPKNKKKIDFFSDVPTLLKSQNIQYQKD